MGSKLTDEEKQSLETRFVKQKISSPFYYFAVIDNKLTDKDFKRIIFRLPSELKSTLTKLREARADNPEFVNDLIKSAFKGRWTLPKDTNLLHELLMQDINNNVKDCRDQQYLEAKFAIQNIFDDLLENLPSQFPENKTWEQTFEILHYGRNENEPHYQKLSQRLQYWTKQTTVPSDPNPSEDIEFWKWEFQATIGVIESFIVKEVEGKNKLLPKFETDEQKLHALLGCAIDWTMQLEGKAQYDLQNFQTIKTEKDLYQKATGSESVADARSLLSRGLRAVILRSFEIEVEYGLEEQASIEQHKGEIKTFLDAASQITDREFSKELSTITSQVTSGNYIPRI